MKVSKLIKELALAVALMAGGAAASAQTTNTVVAQFGTAPTPGNSFTVNLVNTGDTKEIAGFSFRISYNPAQASLVAVNNNTGDTNAGLQYDLGPERTDADGLAYREILASTVVNLKAVGNLAELKFEAKPGYVGPFQFGLQDRVHSAQQIDGLQGPTVENVPHVFDTTQVTK